MEPHNVAGFMNEIDGHAQKFNMSRTQDVGYTCDLSHTRMMSHLVIYLLEIEVSEGEPELTALRPGGAVSHFTGRGQ